MAKLKRNSRPRVYSTEHGRICPNCGKPVDGCVCSRKKIAPISDGIVRVGRETKGRKGQGVTTISGIPLDVSGMMAFAKQLKCRCGSGGTVKDGIVQIQGDHRDIIIAELEKHGWRVKRCGG